jgi:hypothetical protein
MTQYYPADKTDLMLKMASETFHGLKDYCEKVAAENEYLKQQCASLKEAAAKVDKVELQKVASASQENVEAFVDMLVDRSIIKATDREKYAACAVDPDAMLKIAMNAIRLSDTPARQGKGVKSASNSLNVTESDENEAWLRAAKGGLWN